MRAVSSGLADVRITGTVGRQTMTLGGHEVSGVQDVTIRITGDSLYEVDVTFVTDKLTVEGTP